MINATSVYTMYKPTGINLQNKNHRISDERQIEYNLKRKVILLNITVEAISAVEIAKETGYEGNTVRNHLRSLIEDKEILRVYPGKPGVFVKAVK